MPFPSFSFSSSYPLASLPPVHPHSWQCQPSTPFLLFLGKPFILPLYKVSCLLTIVNVSLSDSMASTTIALYTFILGLSSLSFSLAPPALFLLSLWMLLLTQCLLLRPDVPQVAINSFASFQSMACAHGLHAPQLHIAPRSYSSVLSYALSDNGPTSESLAHIHLGTSNIWNPVDYTHPLLEWDAVLHVRRAMRAKTCPNLADGFKKVLNMSKCDMTQPCLTAYIGDQSDNKSFTLTPASLFIQWSNNLSLPILPLS